MNFNDLAREVHQNAVEHGWWDEERSFGDIIALCHSELSEALEEYRAKRPMVYHVCRASDGCPCDREACGDWNPESGACDLGVMDEKPEGIAVELADCIIRVLDYMGKEGFDVDALLREAPKAVMCDVPVRVYAASLGDRIARWHLLLSLAYACWCNSAGTHAAALRMALCICEIVEWAEEAGVDMEMVLDTKHEYNKTRPYRHGGKAL